MGDCVYGGDSGRRLLLVQEERGALNIYIQQLSLIPEATCRKFVDDSIDASGTFVHVSIVQSM
jgi:hypothetical protein